MATMATSIRIPSEISERYTRLAHETGRTRAYYFNEALSKSIDQLEYEYGLLKQVEDYRAGRLETISHEEIMHEFGLA